MSDPTGNNYDDDDRHPRRRKSENPFDDIFKHFMNQFGGFNFENLFDQMDYFLEDIFRRFNVRNLMNDSSKSPGFVWGFRMTKGPDGRPHVERFGNTPRKVGSSPNLRPSLEREPLVDIIDDTDVLRVIAEIPGVSKKDIELSTTENSLLIQAESNDKKRKYFKELDLPCAIFPESASAKFKNGVLEVELKKDISKDQTGTKVRIG
ncbi:MAG: archaeal heat shock protein Hsp20 [Candidatus Hodarchaeales archaeon]|jgi:HSP20 family protein